MSILSFGDFVVDLLGEEVHPDIMNTLNSPNTSAQHKLTAVSKKILDAVKRGDESGLEDAKPKKGSSRAVFFPKEPHKATIDGVETAIPSVLKVAFPGQLDKYNKSGMLLGEHQNEVEADHFARHNYGILRSAESGGENDFETNRETGVLAPVLHSHSDNHWLHMGRVRPFTAGEFRELTKNEDFPKGISHDEFHDAVQKVYNDAHGQSTYSKTPVEKLEHIADMHPFASSVASFIMDTGAHPGDYNKRNLGVWEHPVTGERHPVISDYGFSDGVAKEYQNARMNRMKANRGY